MHEYPHENGDVIVLGPQVFVSRDEAVLNWKGRNYVSQAERDRLRDALREVYFHLGPPQPPGHEVGYEGVLALVEKAMAERDRLRVVVEAARAWRKLRDAAPLHPTTHSELALEEAADVALDELYEELDALDVSADMGWHCRCGTRYDVGQSICPDCGTARQRMPGSAESWDAAAGEKP
jgi:hypothetical protein